MRKKDSTYTVLTRGAESLGTWSQREVSKITNGLRTEVYQVDQLPQYLIVYGAFTKEEVLRATGGGCTFTAEQVIGRDNADLPFRPPI